MTAVEFPGLMGLKINISRVAFTVFGHEVFWYGIIISIGLLLGMLLALRSCEKFGIKKDDVSDLLIFAVPSSIIMARLYYVAFSWEDFRGDILSIINIRTGGLAIYGAVLGAIIGAYIFTKVRKINTWKMFDFLVVYIPLGQAIGRWGNFFNQEAFGKNTSLPWGMKSESIASELTYLKEYPSASIDPTWNIDPLLPVHPTFLYESLWNFGLFFLLVWYRRRAKFEGEVFAMYMALYGMGRFLVEGLRTDSLMIGAIRASQMLALVFFIIFVAYIIKKRREVSKESIETKVNPDIE